MSAKALQDLLRFLTQDAKVPLATVSMKLDTLGGTHTNSSFEGDVEDQRSPTT
jgi:hypothetical protein